MAYCGGLPHSLLILIFNLLGRKSNCEVHKDDIYVCGVIICVFCEMSLFSSCDKIRTGCARKKTLPDKCNMQYLNSN